MPDHESASRAALGDEAWSLHIHQQRMWRASLQPDSLLSFEEAAEALPCPEPLAQSWLTAQTAFGCIHDLPVYRWGDLVELVRAGKGPSSKASAGDSSPGTWLTTTQVAEHLGINRCTLDEMLAAAPRDLPGSPVQIGVGSKKRHLRWDAERIEEWFAAVQAWRQARASAGTAGPSSGPIRPPTPAPRRSRKPRSPSGRSVLAMVGGPSE